MSTASPAVAEATYDITPQAPEPVRARSQTDAQEIDRLIQAGSTSLRLPPKLESRFLRDTSHDRLRIIVISGLLVALTYGGMLIPDWILIPDQFDLAVRLRMVVYVPLVLASLLVLVRIDLPKLREAIAAASGLLAAGISAYLCYASKDELAPAYLVNLCMVVMFCNALAQMRFWPALFMDVGVMALYVVTAVSMDAPAALMLPEGLVVLSTIVFTLYGCYVLERDERQNWLLHLKERLLLDELEAANGHLDQISRSDMLTGVANRRHFDEFLQQVWERARVDGTEVSLMMIDVDHFKAYNDRYGHIEGDACLKDVAATLKRRLRRPDDLIARFGGEEFIAVLTGTPLKTALGAAERVRKGVEALNRLHSGSSTHAILTVSIGVACLKPNAPHASSTQLIAAADEALYQAKHTGRNRVFAFGTHN